MSSTVAEPSSDNVKDDKPSPLLKKLSKATDKDFNEEPNEVKPNQIKSEADGAVGGQSHSGDPNSIEDHSSQGHDAHEHEPIEPKAHGAEEEQSHSGDLHPIEDHSSQGHDVHDDEHFEAQDSHHEMEFGSGDAHNGKPPKGDAGNALAICLLSGVVILPIGGFMLSGDGEIASVTLKMLDTFISIFLAVLWFNFYDTALGYFRVRDAFPYAEQVVTVTHVLMLYVVALLIAFAWRNRHVQLVSFCSCAAHYIAFAGIASGDSVQRQADQVWASFSACLVFLLVGGGISFVSHFWFLHQIDKWTGEMNDDELEEFNQMSPRSRAAKSDNRGLQRAFDELELDIIGLVLSFMITQAIRHSLAGEYPSVHLLQTQPWGALFHEGAGHDINLLGNPGHEHVSVFDRYFMLCWSMMLTLACFVLLPKLHNFELQGYWHEKLVHVIKVLVIMLMAWGYLLWGEWEFQAAFGDRGPLFGHLVFSVLATLTAFVILFFLAKIDTYNRSVHESIEICIDGVALVSAWSWEHCFNKAFNVFGDNFQVGYGGLVPKGCLAVFIPMCVLPLYLTYVKPKLIEEIDDERDVKHGKRMASPLDSARGAGRAPYSPPPTRSGTVHYKARLQKEEKKRQKQGTDSRRSSGATSHFGSSLGHPTPRGQP